MTQTQQQGGFAQGYIDVATRIAEFRRLHPGGSLRPVNPDQPITVISIGDKTYLQYVAAAYRTPDDQCPGIGISWELFPGKTPFTRDSEAANAETSAWGRAIVAALAADTKHGVASLDEVENAKSRATSTPEPVKKRQAPIAAQAPAAGPGGISDPQIKKIGILRRELGIDDSAYRDRLGRLYGVPSTKDLTAAQASDLIEKLQTARDQRGS